MNESFDNDIHAVKKQKKLCICQMKYQITIFYFLFSVFHNFVLNEINCKITVNNFPDYTCILTQKMKYKNVLMKKKLSLRLFIE